MSIPSARLNQTAAMEDEFKADLEELASLLRLLLHVGGQLWSLSIDPSLLCYPFNLPKIRPLMNSIGTQSRAS